MTFTSLQPFLIKSISLAAKFSCALLASPGIHGCRSHPLFKWVPLNDHTSLAFVYGEWLGSRKSSHLENPGLSAGMLAGGGGLLWLSDLMGVIVFNVLYQFPLMSLKPPPTSKTSSLDIFADLSSVVGCLKWCQREWWGSWGTSDPFKSHPRQFLLCLALDI